MTRTEMMKTLYRAASDDLVRSGYSFAARRSDAEAYLDNEAGYGGSTLYRAKVEIDGLLDLTGDDPWAQLSEALGEEVDQQKWGWYFPNTIAGVGSERVHAALVEAGYHWVKFVTDHPENCIVYAPISDEAVDAAEGAMEEIVG